MPRSFGRGRQTTMSKSLPVLQNAPEAASDAIKLASLNEASLDWDELDCVLADLDDFANVLSIMGKEAGHENTPQDRVFAGIVEARDLFVAGTLVALQIRYEFADSTWFDTLMREPTGARLVRMPESD